MRQLGKLLYTLTHRAVPYMPGWSKRRVRTLIIDDTGNVLLIKGWFSSQHWTLPGGGVNPGEDERAAGVREVKEETGLHITEDDLRYLTTLTSTRLKAELPLYVATVTNTTDLPKLHFPYNIEIIDRKWFPIQTLPTGVSAHTLRALELAQSNDN